MITGYTENKRSHINNKKPSPEKTIKLPDPSRVIPTQPIPINKKRSENLSEMCNFEPAMHSFTPPDKYFMQNLRRRMETA
jgi:hypothetical protein